MKAKLFVRAFVKFCLGVVLVGALLFLPAGTLAFPNGWLLMGLLFVPMFLAGLVLLFKNPDLLALRLKLNETQKEQRLVVGLSGLMFAVGFALAGFGVRFGWYALPKRAVIVGAVVFVLAYVLYAQVLRENPYLSRTVEVQEDQRVIDTGLYGIVRHPMYSATVLLFSSMPIILGSIYAFVLFLVYPVLIAGRIRYEETLLEKELPGYREYKQKVNYRLLPFVW